MVRVETYRFLLCEYEADRSQFWLLYCLQSTPQREGEEEGEGKGDREGEGEGEGDGDRDGDGKRRRRVRGVWKGGPRGGREGIGCGFSGFGRQFGESRSLHLLTCRMRCPAGAFPERPRCRLRPPPLARPSATPGPWNTDDIPRTLATYVQEIPPPPLPLHYQQYNIQYHKGDLLRGFLTHFSEPGKSGRAGGEWKGRWGVEGPVGSGRAGGEWKGRWRVEGRRGVERRRGQELKSESREFLFNLQQPQRGPEEAPPDSKTPGYQGDTRSSASFASASQETIRT